MLLAHADIVKFVRWEFNGNLTHAGVNPRLVDIITMPRATMHP